MSFPKDKSAYMRVYPESCISMYCGETTCRDTCPHLETLKAFKDWKQKHNAKCNHPDSLIYYATQ